MVESLARRERGGQRRVVRDAFVNGFAAYGIRFLDRLLALGGVHDEIELVVLDHVHDMRPSLTDLVRAAAGHAGLLQNPRSAIGGYDFEAMRDEALREIHGAGLVPLPHADEAHTPARQGHARGGLRLGIRLTESTSR